MDNLTHLAKRRRKNEIKFLRFDFVVQQTNYKEMTLFIEIGKKFNVDKCYFSLLTDWGTWPVEEYKKHAIWKSDHPDFSNFIEVMKDDIFDDEIVMLGNVTEYRNNAR
jgi:hypothetical protein